MIPELDQEQLDLWMAAAQGDAVSEPDNSIYAQWNEAMQTHAAATESGTLPQTSFWIVISLPKKDFSKRIEEHPTLPIMIPASGMGDLVGIATSKAELDKMTTPSGPGPKEGERWKSDKRRDKIFLAYKIRLQGRQTWRDLIEFCGERDMLINAN